MQHKKEKKVLYEILKFKESLSKNIRDTIKHLFVTYASETLKYRRSDGQPVSTWREVKIASQVEYTEGRIESSFDLLYKSFPTGWETLQEDMLLHELKVTYRPWTSDNKAPKGFMAKFFSSLLSCKRKKIEYVR